MQLNSYDYHDCESNLKNLINMHRVKTTVVTPDSFSRIRIWINIFLIVVTNDFECFATFWIGFIENYGNYLTNYKILHIYSRRDLVKIKGSILDNSNNVIRRLLD